MTINQKARITKWQSLVLSRVCYTSEKASLLHEFNQQKIDWNQEIEQILSSILIGVQISDTLLKEYNWKTKEEIDQFTKGNGFVFKIDHVNPMQVGYIWIPDQTAKRIVAASTKDPLFVKEAWIQKEWIATLIEGIMGAFIYELVQNKRIDQVSIKHVDQIDSNSPYYYLFGVSMKISNNVEQLYYMCNNELILFYNQHQKQIGFKDLVLSHPIAESTIIPVSFEIGRTLLRREEIDELHVDDIICMEWGNYFKGKGHLYLSLLDSSLLYGKIENKLLSIKGTSPFLELEDSKEVSTMSNKETEATAPVPNKLPTNSAPTEDKNVPTASVASTISDKLQNTSFFVVYELGTESMKLKDIMNLQEGSVISIPHNDYVLIKVRGNVIGQGRVVHVGEQLGVQITSLEGK